MKILKGDILIQFLIGASVLATGGGGSYEKAKNLLKNTSVNLNGLNELNSNDIVCTVFGVGGKQVNDPVKSAVNAFQVFKKLFTEKVTAIIPVEIGPLASAISIFIADKINLPIVDADIVGMRSSPEVFLETITLKNLKREPSVIANESDAAILYRSRSYEMTENFFRNFAEQSGGDAFVVGYPLRIKEIKDVVARGSVSASIQIGKDLGKVEEGKKCLKEFCIRNYFKYIGEGKIVKEQKEVKKGFTVGKYIIKLTKESFLEVVIKNENIVCIKNKSVIVTTPDLICLIEKESLIGTNNFSKNINKDVIVLAKKAIPIWRSKKGRELFSPKNLGLNFKQKLL